MGSMKKSLFMFVFLAGSNVLAQQWTAPQNLIPGDVGGSWTTGGGAHSLAVRGDTLYLVWYNASAGVVDMGHQVYFMLYDGTAWQPAQMISPLVNWRRHSWFPSCAVDPYGNLHVVWETNDFVATGISIYDIGYRRLSNGSWSSAVNVTGNAVQGYSWYPAIGCGEDGRVHIAWQDNRQGTFRIFYRQLAAGAWGGTVCLDTGGVYSTLPSLAMIGNEVAVAWQGFRDGTAQIYLKMTSDRAWGEDSCLSQSPTGAYSPALASDPAGGLHLAWEDTRDGNSEIYYRSYRNTTHSWGPVSRITSDPYHSRQPALEGWPGTTHNASLFWTDDRSGSYEVFTKVLQDGVWQPETMLTTTDGRSSLYPSPAADVNGDLNLVWTDFSPSYQLPDGSYYNSPDIFYVKGLLSKGSGTVGLETETVTPVISFLSASPNPFRNGTSIGFQVATGGKAKVTVYNIAGQKIRQLFAGELGSGASRIYWDSRDDCGNKVAAGVYLVKMEAPGGTATGKMLILR
jgi:hypothetical protein